MNRSYSKIRHIQESNLILENRRIINKKNSSLKNYLFENPISDSPSSPDKDLVEKLKLKGYTVTSNPNVFENKGSYVSIYNTSVASCCFNNTVTGGKLSKGSNNIENAISNAESFRDKGYVDIDGKKYDCQKMP